jgi:hypothetical protein
VTNKDNNYVQVWLEGNTTPIRTLSTGLDSPYGIFVTITGDIYVDNGYTHHQVNLWTLNATNGVTTMYVSGRCWGVFLDIYENLYCSLYDSHQVIKRSFNNSANTTTILAGNGSAGSASNMLDNPRGIFVDTDLNLYVADYANNRIQFFRLGELNGTTVAGSSASGTITLSGPAGVVLDADGYLFISDNYNNRIIGSFPNGFRCIIGCSEVSGSDSNDLNSPWGISFDSYGNLFVADGYNSRIQKFFLATNSCGKYSTYE